MPPCCSAGGIFSVALSVTEPHCGELSSTPLTEVSNSTLQRSLRGRPLALPGALPSCPEAAVKQLRGYPKTEALWYFVTGSCEPTTTVSGLSSRPDCSRPAITRPVRQFHYSPNSAPPSPEVEAPELQCGGRTFPQVEAPELQSGERRLQAPRQCPQHKKNGLQPWSDSCTLYYTLILSTNVLPSSNRPHFLRDIRDRFTSRRPSIRTHGDAAHELPLR